MRRREGGTMAVTKNDTQGMCSAAAASRVHENTHVAHSTPTCDSSFSRALALPASVVSYCSWCSSKTSSPSCTFFRVLSAGSGDAGRGTQCVPRAQVRREPGGRAGDSGGGIAAAGGIAQGRPVDVLWRHGRPHKHLTAHWRLPGSKLAPTVGVRRWGDGHEGRNTPLGGSTHQSPAGACEVKTSPLFPRSSRAVDACTPASEGVDHGRPLKTTKALRQLQEGARHKERHAAARTANERSRHLSFAAYTGSYYAMFQEML